MSVRFRPHQSCHLLTHQENDVLFSLVPEDCQSIYWTVCQVLVTDSDTEHRQWSKLSTGVVSLLKDFTCRSFFICLFDLTFDDGCGVLLWKQELYSEMEYVQSTSFAHTFEADTCLVALNFADEQDAQQFYHHVTQKLIALQKKINDASPLQSTDKVSTAAPTHVSPSYSSGLPKSNHGHAHAASSYLLGVQAPVSRSTESLVSNGKKTYRIKSKDKKTKILSKNEIGIPMDFRHVSHIGWDINRGFSFDEHDPLVLSLLKKAGIDVRGKDAKEKEFIYGFIQENLGGVEGIRQRASVKTDHRRNISPMPPPRNSSNVPTIRPAQIKPLPPTVQGRPPPVAPPPPPPPPLLTHHDLEEPEASDALYESLPPAPPPPPPLLLVPPAPRQALLDDISKGITLRKSASENVLTESRPTSERDKLLSDIRTKHTLKPVPFHSSTATSRPSSNEDAGLDTMAQILSRALAQRRESMAIQDDSGENSEEDEWEA